VKLRQSTSETSAPLKLESKELSPDTWPDFAKLFEKHGGVWGGCWCMFFHVSGAWARRTAEQNRKEKEALVNAGKAHGILVYHDGEPIGWCQFGPRDELPRIDSMRGYEPVGKGNSWRITCFFIDRDHRKRGVAKEALRAALAVMKSHGVKRVEAYPVDTAKRKYPPSLMYRGSLRLFEGFGFEKVGKLGKNRYLVSREL